MTLFEVVYEHCGHEWKPFRWICDECGMIELPTPSGKLGVQWAKPVDGPVYRIDLFPEVTLHPLDTLVARRMKTSSTDCETVGALVEVGGEKPTCLYCDEPAVDSFQEYDYQNGTVQSLWFCDDESHQATAFMLGAPTREGDK